MSALTLNVTVSGSFTRHIQNVQRAVSDFKARDVKVLSPAEPTVVGQLEGFVFVASDVHRSPRLVQDRHLAAIEKSDFLWLICPDGYVGQSASLEIGYAVARGIPVMAQHAPNDLTLRQYVVVVKNCAEAIARAQRFERRASKENSISLLVDPVAATEAAHEAVSNLRSMLTRSSDIEGGRNLDEFVDRERRRASELILNR